MRKAGLFALWSLATTICVFWLYLGGCNDRRTFAPDNSPGEPAEYLFWFVDDDDVDKTIYGYSPSRGIVDSANLPFDPISPTSLSADGGTMYASTDQGVIAIDLLTKSFSTFWPTPATVVASPDGKLLAISDGDLHIVDATDLSVLYHDSLAVERGVFSQNSQTFYGLASDSVRFVYKLSLSDGFPVSRKSFGDWFSYMIYPSPDESTWYILHQSHSCASILRVYDAIRDSTLHFEGLNPGYGDLVVSPNGRHAYYSNPGKIVSFECNPFPYDEMISVYDRTTNSVVSRLSTIGRYGDNDQIDTTIPINAMAMTPDGKWLLGTNSGNRFVLVNAETMVIERYEGWGEEFFAHRFHYPVAQPGL